MKTVRNQKELQQSNCPKKSNRRKSSLTANKRTDAACKKPSGPVNELRLLLTICGIRR